MPFRAAAALAAGLAFGMTAAEANDLATKSAHDFAFTAIDGSALPLSAYKGKTVLVVNTASKCSFTKQYGPLQTLYERYRDRGFVVVGVPSNNFGRQEPGTEDEIEDFTKREFEVEFPLTAKTDVVGKNASPFYRWAAAQSGPLGKPRWNFHKYLIGPDGELIDWFSTMTEPNSKKLQRAIEQNLPANG